MSKRPKNPTDHWHDDLEPWPVPLPDGGELVTMRDAGDFIARLSKREQSKPEWQPATQDLLRAASGHWLWRFIARLAIMHALYGKPSRRLAIHAMRRRRRSGAVEGSQIRGAAEGTSPKQRAANLAVLRLTAIRDAAGSARSGCVSRRDGPAISVALKN